MKVFFLHPDLGIGGAERLVVDAAVALKRHGHEVAFHTNHFDEAHCFEELRRGRIPIEVTGAWLPRSILGRCRALCAYVRFFYLALYLALCVMPRERPDVAFCDLISTCVPALKLSPHKARVVFYCHHPDKLLTAPGGAWKRLYRRPLDWAEERCVALADEVLVNSEYTSGVYKEAFRSIATRPRVCYPSVDTRAFDAYESGPSSSSNEITILSINRYERKKNVGLVLGAMRLLLDALEPERRSRILLIVAGGHDPRNAENVEHYAELVALAKRLGIERSVRFLKSPSDAEKARLLRECRAVAYTPSHEHFGIVPLEAMYNARPVVAVNSGGPTETIVHNVTGFLCPPDEADFAEHLRRLAVGEDLARKMGEAGRQRFDARFSFDAFAEHLDSIIRAKKRD